MSGKARALAVALLICAPIARAGSAKITKESASFQGQSRVYYLYVPSTAPGEKMPLILTLHGSGRNGETLVSRWKDLAEKEHIVLVGPDAIDSRVWSSPADGPLFLHQLVEQVREKAPVDGRRIYLFGHSAGAVFGLQMAALESEYFAAVSVHAGAIEPRYLNVFDYAARKIPVQIFIGTRDAFFPLDAVQATREALKSRGFPVDYVEMPGHTHEYYGSAKEINAKAWEFLRKTRLPAEPNYTVYKNSD